MPDALDDRYEIGERIGTGGLSDVHAAFDRRLGRPVAVKFLRASMGDPRAVARFEREARLAASFNHPNAVTIYDVGEHEGRPFLVLELVDGESLAELLSRRGSLDVSETVAIIEQVLSALGAAHAQGLVHRDVKPGNILLTHDGVAKLADFGIAKAVADANVGLTATGEVMGTPRYLSPEQVSGLPATPRSDIYAVGVVMYEMLAGQPPFTGETPIAVALAHQREAVPSLAARRPGLDVHIEAVVTRALEKDPARRFASADEMRHALLGVTEPTAASDTAATVSATVPTEVIVAAPAVLPRAQPRRSSARAWTIGAAVTLAALLVALAVVVLTNDDEPGSGSVTVTDAPSTTAPPTTSTVPPTTAPTAPPTTLPPSLDALAAALAGNSAAYGRHGKELANDLKKLQQDLAKPPGKKGETDVSKDAQKAIADVNKWVAEGSLDRTLATQVVLVLQRYA